MIRWLVIGPNRKLTSREERRLAAIGDALVAVIAVGLFYYLGETP